MKTRSGQNYRPTNDESNKQIKQKSPEKREEIKPKSKVNKTKSKIVLKNEKIVKRKETETQSTPKRKSIRSVETTTKKKKSSPQPSVPQRETRSNSRTTRDSVKIQTIEKKEKTKIVKKVNKKVKKSNERIEEKKERKGEELKSETTSEAVITEEREEEEKREEEDEEDEKQEEEEEIDEEEKCEQTNDTISIERVEEEKEEEEVMTNTKSNKRRTEERNEPAKRVRRSRFEVPSAPQVCGQVFGVGEDIAGELAFRQKHFNGQRVKANEPSVVVMDGEGGGEALDSVCAVVCGAMHSCCLTSDQKVVTFGCNDDSALGRQTEVQSDGSDDTLTDDEERVCKTPKEVVGLPPIVRISAGDMHTCALSNDGSVYVWGNFKDESKKLGLFVESVRHVNSEGISGDDYTSTPLPTRVDVGGGGGGEETKVVDIASGCHHVLLLTEEGHVLSFGEGSKGQLGRVERKDLMTIDSDRKLFLNAAKVDFGGGEGGEDVIIEKIWANHWSSYAKSTTGEIFVWGLNNYHQLSFRSEDFVDVTNPDPNQSQHSLRYVIQLKPIRAKQMPTNVTSIANGQQHVLVLDADGHVYSCGGTTYGKLGFKAQQPQQHSHSSSSDDHSVDTLTPIGSEAFGGQKVTHIACGCFCSFAITESGHLYTWGMASEHMGSTSDGQQVDFEVPTLMKGVLADTTRFVSVSSGSQHTLLIGNGLTLNGN